MSHLRPPATRLSATPPASMFHAAIIALNQLAGHVHRSPAVSLIRHVNKSTARRAFALQDRVSPSQYAVFVTPRATERAATDLIALRPIAPLCAINLSQLTVQPKTAPNDHAMLRHVSPKTARLLRLSALLLGM
jgi:hypothetical protein